MWLFYQNISTINNNWCCNVFRFEILKFWNFNVWYLMIKCVFFYFFQNGDTALHISAAMGRRKLTRVLLESNCSRNVRNKVILFCSCSCWCCYYWSCYCWCLMLLWLLWLLLLLMLLMLLILMLLFWWCSCYYYFCYWSCCYCCNYWCYWKC